MIKKEVLEIMEQKGRLGRVGKEREGVKEGGNNI